MSRSRQLILSSRGCERIHSLFKSFRMNSRVRDRYLTVLIRISILVVPIFLILALLGLSWSNKLEYATGEEFFVRQPVAFSHRHHVKGLKIDCQFCHTQVQEGRWAGLPSPKTCMECHSQIWTDSPALEKVRQAYARGEAVEWKRVNPLPDFVFFNHQVHMKNKSISCQNCHGKIEEMPLTAKARPLTMRWCLECHHQAEKYVENLPAAQKRSLTDCYACHR